MARFVEVTLGVPGLGIVKEIYDLDNPGDCQAWDTNVANGCSTLVIKQLGHADQRKGNTMNVEQNTPMVERPLGIDAGDKHFDDVLAIRNTDEPVAAEKLVYVSVDDADEADQDKTIH